MCERVVCESVGCVRVVCELAMPLCQCVKELHVKELCYVGKSCVCE